MKKRLSHPRLGRLSLVIAVCALVGALAGIAGSAAAPSKKSSAKAAGARAAGPPGLGGPRGPGGPGGPGGPAVHEQRVVLDKSGKGYVTVTADAGTVKAISGSDVTIAEGVGGVPYKDVDVTIPSGATVIRDHAKASLTDIKQGDEIRVATSSEGAFVMAEDQAFHAAEHKRFGRGGPWDHDRGMPSPPPPGSGPIP